MACFAVLFLVVFCAISLAHTGNVSLVNTTSSPVDSHSSTDSFCNQPFRAHPTSELVTGLTAALASEDKQLIDLNVHFSDEQGRIFSPGACPSSRSSTALGLPLLWLIKRGRFGKAFTKVPLAHVEIYTLFGPYKKFRWSGVLRVTVQDTCWRNLSYDDKVERLANVVGPLLLNR